jgi:hypothetical protein
MKSNKNMDTKRNLKPTAPAKMKSAITNLNQLVQPPAQAEKGASNGASERKARSVKPLASETQQGKRPVTSVAAKIDVGFGNALFIRGQGPGLSWETGTPLKCRDGSIWVWSADNGKEKIEFKLLLNDQVWAEGDNITIAAGEKIEVVPRF